MSYALNCENGTMGIFLGVVSVNSPNEGIGYVPIKSYDDAGTPTESNSSINFTALISGSSEASTEILLPSAMQPLASAQQGSNVNFNGVTGTRETYPLGCIVHQSKISFIHSAWIDLLLNYELLYSWQDSREN